MESPQDRVRVVQLESERLKQYLAALPFESFDRPSAVDGWKIGDVVGHLCFGSGSYLMFLERALKGDTSTPEGFWEPGAISATAAAKIDSAGSERWARLGDQLIPTVVENVDRLSQLLGGLSPSDFDRPTYHLVFGIVPIKATLVWWTTELAQHGWDFRSVLEPDTHLSADSLRIFMAFIPEVVRWSLRRGEKLPKPLRFRFELTATRNDIVVYGDEARMTPVSDSPADTTIHCDTETFSLLMMGRGRLRWDAVVAAGRAEVEGDRDLVPRFAQWFPGT